MTFVLPLTFALLAFQVGAGGWRGAGDAPDGVPYAMTESGLSGARATAALAADTGVGPSPDGAEVLRREMCPEYRAEPTGLGGDT